jgi:DNA invertase Pin-like site-specific DNA recombinase
MDIAIEKSMLIGYARISTQDQNLKLQIEALKKAGCKKILDDEISGSRADRPGLNKALEILRLLFGSWIALAAASKI